MAWLLTQINKVPMGLKTTGFLLTDAELEEVNRYLRAKATAHSRAGEDPPDSVRGVFEFSPVFGRDVSVYFDGAVNGYCITDGSTENHEPKA